MAAVQHMARPRLNQGHDMPQFQVDEDLAVLVEKLASYG
jgi:hypothetical protein